MAQIVLVEDDVDIRRLLAERLSKAGHGVESAASAIEGLQLVLARRPDLIILDLGLPDLGGAELLRMIRAVSAIPVIIATAIGDEESAIALLDAGADDYIVKPFAASHLEARVRALLRRTEAAPVDETIQVGPLEIRSASRVVTLAGEPLDLSPKEFDLLRVLAERAGEVLSKRELLAEVWREPYGGSERTVDVHLSWLRKKLGESAKEPRFLHTIHGVGVKLVEPL